MRAPKIEIRFWAVLAIVGGLVLSRLLPHPDNFTPIIAAALFGGAYFDRRVIALFVPLAAMLLSDIVLELFFVRRGFHDLMLVVYGSFALTVGLGVILRRFRAIYAPPLMAVLASTLFFITTNFGVWLMSELYPMTLAGLAACYIAALPFFGQALIGDVLWTSLIFGLWHLANRQFPILSR